MKNLVSLVVLLATCACAPVPTTDDQGRPLLRVYEARAILKSGTLETPEDHIDLMGRVRGGGDPLMTEAHYSTLVREVTESFVTLQPNFNEVTRLVTKVGRNHWPCVASRVIDEVPLTQEQIIQLDRDTYSVMAPCLPELRRAVADALGRSEGT